MSDVKSIIAKNITELRLLNNMTQLDLAEKLNYSDKTISKWERAESSPDISVLVEIADLFGITLDELVRGEITESNTPSENAAPKKKNPATYNRRAISYIAESTVWFVAIFAYIITSLIVRKNTFQWLYFIYALPIALTVRLIFNSIWFNRRHNYFIVSGIVWSVLATIHITFMYFKIDVALIYILGIAGQAVIYLWSRIRKPVKQERTVENKRAEEV